MFHIPSAAREPYDLRDPWQWAIGIWPSERREKLVLLFRIIHNIELIVVEHNERGAKTTSRVARWSDVFHVVAFKRDRCHVDLICMEIQDRMNSSIEIDEEMEGWKELVAMLPAYLPGFPRFGEWFLRVATPAFETCPTELYRRA